MKDDKYTILFDLCDAVREGTITEGQLSELDNILSQDELACKYYYEYIAMCAALKNDKAISHEFGLYLQLSAARESDILDKMAKYEASAPSIDIPENNAVELDKAKDSILPDQRSRRANIISFALSTAAVILILISFAVLDFWLRSTADGNNKNVAFVSDQINAQWENSFDPDNDNRNMKPGVYTLINGFAQIHLNTGVDLILEAPAKINLFSGNTMYLAEGRLTANVSRQAIGFTVDTPAASITDFGTRFGIYTDGLQMTEAYVKSGIIEMEAVSSGDSESPHSVRLIANQACRATSDQIVNIELDTDSFAFDMPTRFDLTAKSLGAIMHLKVDGDHPAVLRNNIPGSTLDITVNPQMYSVSGPVLTGNKQSSSLRVFGSEPAVTVNNMRSLAQHKNYYYTIGYWVKLNSIEPQFICADSPDSGDNWRVNMIDSEGKLEHFAYSVDLDKAKTARGSITLETNKWYFITIVRASNDTSYKYMYINGQKVSASENDKAEFVAPYSTFIIGGDFDGIKGMDGAISDIILFSGQLSDRQIESLYNSAFN